MCHETRAGLKIVAREHIIVAKIVCWPLLFIVVVVVVAVGSIVVVGVGVC
jgi:t-SNARE complex subunit (syntaxin)